jgi:hypothetical protein
VAVSLAPVLTTSLNLQTRGLESATIEGHMILIEQNEPEFISGAANYERHPRRSTPMARGISAYNPILFDYRMKNIRSTSQRRQKP